ncbi:MAG: transposase, partial [candidate division WOR-3 bacterium]|nr:transposase [candidate division WOR-3 bacterium]
PYHKNDNPVAESRNFTLVRAYVGYCRYDTDAEYEVLKELMPLICTLHNYFIPKMMLKRKERVGGKVFKVYDIDTPYNRVLNCPAIAEKKKQQLRERKATLSYFGLLARIIKLQKKLDRVHRKRYNHRRKDD